MVLLAAGRGQGRVPTCEHTLRYAPSRIQRSVLLDDGVRYKQELDLGKYPRFRDGCAATVDYGPNNYLIRYNRSAYRVDLFYPLLVRALSLFAQGELRALRVRDPAIFRIVLAMLQALPQGGAPASHLAQALDSLCAVELECDFISAPSEDAPHVAAVIERCAATVTELKGPLPADLLHQVRSGHPPVLARCARLEVLTEVSSYTPAVWLGLSQLHTLRGVCLNQVSVGAIAAALPRLHTLTCFIPYYSTAHSSVAGFFTDLLPRLRVFDFHGTWPVAAAQSAAAPIALPPPLSGLEKLVWDECSPQPTVLREFLGARPIFVRAPSELIAEYLTGRGDGAANRVEPAGFLSRVCELHVVGGTVSIGVSDVARILRETPRMHTFLINRRIRGDASFLKASTAPLHPAFVDLVHRHQRPDNCA
jgi:hypothetical protein